MTSTESISYLQDAWRRFKTNRPATCCLILLCIFCLFALLGPLFSSYSYADIHLEMKNHPPSSLYWLGSDDLGRDLFCRLAWGARISLTVGLTAALLDGVIGVIWGTLAAHCGGLIDDLLMRICDILSTIPHLLMAMLLMMFMGPGLTTVFTALALTGWINMARITRAQILQIKQNDYVTAAIIAGAPWQRIASRHLIPNALGPILATLTLTIPTAIFTEAFLSFLGLGLPPPYASLGVMINDGIGAMAFYPWRLFFPSAILTLIMLSFNLIGNALRDALDPRLRS